MTTAIRLMLFILVITPTTALAEVSGLHIAARTGNAKQVQKLLDRGADVDSQVINGTTALHQAAMNGHVNVVKVLLKAGADVEIREEEGNTALHLAIGGIP